MHRPTAPLTPIDELLSLSIAILPKLRPWKQGDALLHRGSLKTICRFVTHESFEAAPTHDPILGRDRLIDSYLHADQMAVHAMVKLRSLKYNQSRNAQVK